MKAKIRRAGLSDVRHVQILLEHLTGNALGRQAAEDRLRMIDTSPSDELYLLEDDDGVQGLLGFRIRGEEDAHKFYKKLGYQVTGYRFVKPI
jgi:hypothetical protein